MGNCRKYFRLCLLLLQVLLKQWNALLQSHAGCRIDQPVIGRYFNMFALVASINIEHSQGLAGRLLLNEGVVVLLEAANCMILQNHGPAAQDLEALLKIAYMLTR